MENTYGTATYGNNNQSLEETAKETVKDVKNKVSAQVADLGQHMSNKMDQAKDRTYRVLSSTSKTLDQAANYLNNQSYQAMMDDVKDVVRKHPGKSILAGIGLGILIARVCKH